MTASCDSGFYCVWEDNDVTPNMWNMSWWVQASFSDSKTISYQTPNQIIMRSGVRLKKNHACKSLIVTVTTPRPQFQCWRAIYFFVRVDENGSFLISSQNTPLETTLKCGGEGGEGKRSNCSSWRWFFFNLTPDTLTTSFGMPKLSGQTL